MAREVHQLQPRFIQSGGFAASDPVGTQLGSGGGAAHLLVEAWRRTGEIHAVSTDWLRRSRKLLIHAGGQSRRLPAYAAVGKAFIPLPAWRWSVGQRLGQTLLDLQLPLYEDILSRAPSSTVAMLASGDVLLRASGSWPALPRADVVALGLWIRPELAQHFGVLFCPRQRPDRLAFCLQKPAPERTRELAADHLFMLDTGVWLLSERAVLTLLRKCGWDDGSQQFADELPQSYEFYAELTLALGEAPTRPDPEISPLSCAVVPIPQGEFYHFGTSRNLIESTTALHNLVVDQTRIGYLAAKPHPDQHTLNSPIAAVARVRVSIRCGLRTPACRLPGNWRTIMC